MVHLYIYIYVYLGRFVSQAATLLETSNNSVGRES